MKKFLCMHGHFYQPPRENPGLDEVEVQDSAYPFHDWNERVTAECYAPNTAARILDGAGKILKIINNYSKMSFDFGPTLLIWLERHNPEIYEKILEADRISIKEHHGHGNAIAQVYNHIIMPLANRRDKETEVVWGIRDFEHRFKRLPEGMWLSETAVDEETLEVLAENGIRFTILAPYQAHRVRPLNGGDWIDVTGSRIDPSCAYRCRLKSGRSMDLFFYDGPISFSIAFEESLSRGEALIQKIMEGFSTVRTWSQMIVVATDGESYGHHRKFGEMALAYALNKIETSGIVELTNFGEYLEQNPPEWEVEIFEKTAWSCAHGVKRWMEDCGCRINHQEGWNQKWRKPLREGLNWLKGKLDVLFEQEVGKIVTDPWEALRDYISIVLERTETNVNKFFYGHGQKALNQVEKGRALRLFEIQRQGLLMFTSCGWFFDDISGLEPIQIMHYADRAIQMMQKFGEDLEPGLMEYLAKAKSNLSEWGNGKDIYQEVVKPSRVDFYRTAAHWAVSSLFQDHVREGTLFSYDYACSDYQKETYGTGSFSMGIIRMTSKISLEIEEVAFGLLHSGGPDFHCVTCPAAKLDSFDLVKKEIFKKYKEGLITEVLTLLHRNFGDSYLTLKDLFLDERRHILGLVTEENMVKLEETLRRFYEDNKAVMGHLISEEIPLPKGFTLVLDFLLMRDLARFIENIHSLDALQQIEKIVEEAKRWNIVLDLTPLCKAVERCLMEHCKEGNSRKCQKFLRFSMDLKLNVSFWEMQNHFYELFKDGIKDFKGNSLEDLKELGLQLGFDQKLLNG